MTHQHFSIGLIGYGRFGKLLARYLAAYVPVRVFDSRMRQLTSSKRCLRSSLREAAACPVVILAVPVSSLRTLLVAIAPLLLKGTLIIDVCAVKTIPTEWMRKLLPRDVYLLGSHPLFGPQSAGSSLDGHSIVLCPVRLPERLLRRIRAHLKGNGLQVVTMTPRSHDRAIADSLLVTQFVGRSLELAGVRRARVITPAHKRLLSIVDTVKGDSRQLFDDLVRYNPYSAPMIKKLTKGHDKLLSSISHNGFGSDF